MSGESTTRTAPGGRAAQRISGIAVALGLVLFLGGFAWGAVVYRPYTVPTGSMVPTIKIGDRVLAQRVDGADVRRGDVVVFKDSSWANAPMVKRVVAVGGDTVACCQKGKLKVNGKVIEEPYLPSGTPAEIMDFPTVTVPDGRLFLLGDERDNSVDSTAHLTDAARGTVARAAVSARVDAVVWPMDGMLARPTGFEALGPLSSPGPLRTVVALVIAGMVLVLGGAAYGSLAKRAAAARAARTRTKEPAGAR
ncbi:signal peptidase I [Streptomyces sp. NPDC048182]|uniref:signal peptidase I n=1 Tax=Streptomyces sp. NPDC048182 TaxID=3365507 RepID=UPI003724938B